MELLRIGHDVYGREIAQGASWDLVWVFFGIGAVLIVAHAVYRRFFVRGAR